MCKDYKAKNTCEVDSRCRVLALDACIDTPFEFNWDGEKVVKVKYYDKSLFYLGKDGLYKTETGTSKGKVVLIVVVAAFIVTAIFSYFALKN